MDFVWRLFYQLNEWWILLLQYDSAAPALYCWCDLFIIQRNCVFDLVQWNRKFSGSVSYMCIYFQQQGWLFSSCPAGGRAASLDSPPASLLRSLDHIHIPHLLKPRLSVSTDLCAGWKLGWNINTRPPPQVHILNLLRLTCSAVHHFMDVWNWHPIRKHLLF